MGTNYDQDPENALKFQQNLSYASCDRMIKKSPCKVGLKSNIYLNSKSHHGHPISDKVNIYL